MQPEPPPRITPIRPAADSDGRGRQAPASQLQRQREIERQITSRLPELPGGWRRAGRLARFPQLRQLALNYYRDDGDGLATIIAYNALFSLMPLFFTLFFILSLLVKSDMLYDQIIDWTGRALPGGASRSVETMVTRGRENLGEITLIAGVSYLLAGSRFFSSLDRAFSTISRTPRRPFVQRKLASFVMVPLVSLLMILAAFAAAFSTVMLALPDRIFESGTPAWFTGLLTLSVSLGLNFLVALALYTIVPVQKPRWRAVWKGSAVAALLFHLLGQLFPLYLQLTGGFSAYGGAFAFALVLMLWFYLLGQIIVVGAEVNALAAGRGNAPVADEG